MARKTRIDWNKARNLYRAGQLTTAEIAKAVGGKTGTIAKKASEEGWTRDLTAQIAQATRAKTAAIHRKSTDGESDESTIESAAEAASAVLIEHRGHIVRGRLLVQTMFEELGEASIAPKMIEDALLMGLDPEKIDIGKVLAAYSLGSRSKSLSQLTQSLARLIQAERVSYNLDEHKAEKPFEKALREIIENDQSSDDD